MFKRIGLLILVNILVMITVNIVIGVLGAMGFRILPDETLNALLIFCFVYGMGGAFVSLLISKFMAKTFMGVQVIDPNSAYGENAKLVEVVHRLARGAGLPKMPEVGIYDSPEVNAFATGPSRSNSLVAVSTGLLQQLSNDQVEAVLGHEVSHISNGDMVTMTLISGVVNAFVMFFSRIVAKILANALDDRRKSFWIEYLLYIVTSIVFTILGSIVVNYFSRRREFKADAGSAGLVGPDKMASALRALAKRVDMIDTSQTSLATLKISDRPGFMAWFSTHPSLEERIARLEQMPSSTSAFKS